MVKIEIHESKDYHATRKMVEFIKNKLQSNYPLELKVKFVKRNCDPDTASMYLRNYGDRYQIVEIDFFTIFGVRVWKKSRIIFSLDIDFGSPGFTGRKEVFCIIYDPLFFDTIKSEMELYAQIMEADILIIRKEFTKLPKGIRRNYEIK